jgi:hypothetical protein
MERETQFLSPYGIDTARPFKVTGIYMQSQRPLSLELPSMRSMRMIPKSRRMETSDSSMPLGREPLRGPRRLSDSGAGCDTMVQIYCGLIWRYTAKLAGFVAEKSLDKMGRGARYGLRFCCFWPLSLSGIYSLEGGSILNS